MDALTKLAAGRLWAVRQWPYFASGLVALRPKEVPLGTLPSGGEGTMGVTADGVLVYEAKCLERWTPPEVGSVLVHELMHWMRRHAERAKRKASDHMLWNIAADCEINDDLDALKLPDGGGMHPKKFGVPVGKLAEEYYDLLLQQQQQAPSQDDHCCGGISGNPFPGEAEGSGLSGDDAGGSIGHSGQSAEIVRKRIAADISEHAQAHGQGSVPLGLRTWAELELAPAKVPWSAKLQQGCRTAVRVVAGNLDYTFQRMNRRQGGLGYGAGKPVLRAPISRIPEVVIALDTSGSMGREETVESLSEAQAILAALGRTRFLACDAAVHSNQEVGSMQELLALLKGGGGTSFVPIFDAIEKMRPRPDLLVFFTDGCGDAPARPPAGLQVIWVLVGKYQQQPYVSGRGPVTYGEFIEID